MRRVVVSGVLAAVAACGAHAKPSSAWSPQATKEIEANMRTFFVQLDALDGAAIRAGYDENPSVFDVDPTNASIALYGTEAANAYIDQLAALGKDGFKVKTTVNRVDCHATEVMGYCTIEFDQTFDMKGQAMGPFKFRGTSIGRKVGDTWKWSHWHGSFREPPPAAPPPT